MERYCCLCQDRAFRKKLGEKKSLLFKNLKNKRKTDKSISITGTEFWGFFFKLPLLSLFHFHSLYHTVYRQPVSEPLNTTSVKTLLLHMCVGVWLLVSISISVNLLSAAYVLQENKKCRLYGKRKNISTISTSDNQLLCGLT